MDVIASGGIRNAADIRALAKLKLYGAICGKSLYKGTLDLKEAINAAKVPAPRQGGKRPCSPKE